MSGHYKVYLCPNSTNLQIFCNSDRLLATNNLERQCRDKINRQDPQDSKTPGKLSEILAPWCLGDSAVESLSQEGKDLRVSRTNREAKLPAGSSVIEQSKVQIS